MNNRLMKYSLVAGLALLLSWPAIAYSQSGPPGPRFAPGAGQARDFGAVQGAARQRGPQRFAGSNFGPQQRFAGRNLAPQRRFSGRAGGSGVELRGRVGGRGLAGRAGSRGVRSGLAGRALARAEQIGLTEEQREQITEAQRGYREASINRRAAMQIAELELRELTRAETPDIAAVEAKMREVSEERIAQLTGSLRLNAAVSEILAAEQIEKLEERGRGPGGRRAGRNRGRLPDAVAPR